MKLDRIGADVPIVRRHGSSHRRLTMVGSDGSQRHFLVQTSLTPSARSDERMVQLFRVLNRLLEKHKESRRRLLAFNTPIIIPVWPQVCIDQRYDLAILVNCMFLCILALRNDVYLVHVCGNLKFTA